jgi:catalase (peroxidase I)
MNKLQPILTMYPDVSAADLIVLAGITALEDKTDGLSLPFCGGYVDAAAGGVASEFLAPRLYPTAANPDYVLSLMDDFLVKGLTKEEGVVLACRGNISSQYFVDLKAGKLKFSEFEMALLDDEFVSIVNAYAADDALVKTAFAGAWTKMMTAGRYGSFRKNACDGVSTATLKSAKKLTDNTTEPGASGAYARFNVALATGFVLFFFWI